MSFRTPQRSEVEANIGNAAGQFLNTYEELVILRDKLNALMAAGGYGVTKNQIRDFAEQVLLVPAGINNELGKSDEWARLYVAWRDAIVAVETALEPVKGDIRSAA